MKTFTDYGIQVDLSGREEQKVKCPECSGGRKKKHLKDLSVNIKEGIWFCWHCGWKGTLKTGIENHSKRQEFTPMNRQYKKPDPIKSYLLPENVIKYFKEQRKISSDVLEIAGVTFEKAWMPQSGKEETCTVFNYWFDGELINKKYRTGKKQFRLAKDARLILYAPMFKKDFEYKGDLYLTEGEIDCLSLLELGIENALSCPNGAPAENSNLDTIDFSYLQSLDEIFPNYNRVFLIMDSDHVGSRFRDEIARRIGYEKCLKAVYPVDCKDINDVLVKHGKPKALEVVRNCKPYPISGKYNVSDIYSDVIRLYNDGYAPSVSTGWDMVNRLYTVRQKEFTIVTGIPSHGKSAFIDHLMVNIAVEKNWKFGIYSPENYPFERHIAKLCEIYTGKPFDRRYQGFMSEQEAESAIKWCNKHFVFIMPEDEEEHTLDRILELGKASIFNDGIKGLLIDPWNEIDHQLGGDPETIYISKSLSKIRRFCRKKDVHTWIIAHPTKLQKDRKTGKYPVPTPYDIAGSAHFRNKADNCVCIWRDFEEMVTKFYSQKIRFKEIGRVGNTSLKFDIKNNRFYE